MKFSRRRFSKKGRKAGAGLLSLMFILALAVPFVMLLFSATAPVASADPGWWDADWTRRRPVTVSYHPNNWVFRVYVPHDSDMLDNYDDLRFTEEENTGELEYVIEEYDSDGAEVYLFRLYYPDDEVWCYYSNPSAQNVESTAIAYTTPDNASASSMGELLEDFEDVTDWTYSEHETYSALYGAQSDVWKTEGTYSYRLYKISGGAVAQTVDGGDYCQISRSIDLTIVKKLKFNYNLQTNGPVTAGHAKFLVGGVEKWTKDFTVTGENSLEVDVSDLTGPKNIIFKLYFSFSVERYYYYNFYFDELLAIRDALNTIDSDLATKWVPYPANEAGAWCRWDMETTKILGGCRIYWGDYENFRPQAYRIQVSSDGENFGTLETETTDPGQGWKMYFWPAVSNVRYIRLLIDTHGASGTEVYEFGYVTKSEATEPTTSVGDEQIPPVPPEPPSQPWCEGATNPQRVTDFTPEFSAVFIDNNAEDTGTHCEIWVGTQPGDNSVWASGWMGVPDVANGARSQDVSYAGVTLGDDNRGKTFYWKIRFKDSDNSEGAWCTDQNFRLNQLSFAENQRTEGSVNPTRVATLTPSLGWGYADPDGDAQTRRQIQVGTSENDNSMWDSTVSTSATSAAYDGSALSRGDTYHWRVRVYDYEWSTWLYGGTFRLNQLPTTSGLLTEWLPNPTGLTTFTPTFSWAYSDPDDDAQTHRQVQVTTDDTYATITNWNNIVADNAVSTTYGGSPLLRGVTYYVRVLTKDGYEWSEWENGTFKLNSLPIVENLKTEGQVNPTNITDNTPEFSWAYSDDDGDAQSHYQIWVGTNTGLNDMWDTGAVAPTDNLIEYDNVNGGPLQNGVTYYLQVRTKDGAEWSDWAKGTFRINAPPVAQSIAINGGNRYTNSQDVALTLSADDDLGVADMDMAFSFDGENWTAWESYDNSESLILPENEGVQRVYFKVRDGQGWESDVISDTIILDMTKPYNLVGVSPIDNAVMGPTTVRFYWTLARDNISGVVSVYTFKLAKDSDFTQDLYTTTSLKDYVDFPYDNRTGASYWQVRVRDRAGNEENTPAYRFIYDPNAPSLTVRAEKTVLNILGVSITLEGSNIRAYRYAFAEADLEDADWVSYTGAENTLTISLSAEEGQYRVYFEAISEADVIAGPFTVPIRLDFTPPQLTLAVDNLASREPTRTLGFTADDGAGSGISQMRVKIGGDNWGPWENYDETKTIELAAEGFTTVQVQLRDLAGNESAVQSLSLFYSSRPPQLDLSGVPTEASERTYVLRIPASPGVSLFVNGEEIQPNADGYFEKELFLREGQNEFSIVARDLAGNTTEETITITYAAGAAPGVGSKPLLLGAIIAAISAAGVGALLMFRRRKMRRAWAEREERRIEPKAVKPFVKPKRAKHRMKRIERRGRVVRPFAKEEKRRGGKK